jgi:hypothetical protein
MLPFILLGAVAAVILAQLLLRTNAAIVFLALCGGYVLTTMAGKDFSLITSSFSAGRSVPVNAVLIAALVAPALVVMIFLRGSVSAAKLPLMIVPAVATGFTALLLVKEQLSTGMQHTIAKTDTWSLVTQYESLIILVGVVASVLVIVLTVRKHHHDDGKKGHH